MYLIVLEFAKRLINTKNFSKSTIETYIRAVNALDDYMKELTFWARGVDMPHTIELEDVEQFAERERLNGKNIKTVNNHLAWIKKFFRFCNHKGLNVMDFRRILFAREPEYKINALSTDEAKALLNQLRNDYTKDETAEVVKDCYNEEEFDMGDVVKISKGTTKQDELFEYVEASDYYKERVRDYDEGEYDKDDFDLSR